MNIKVLGIDLAKNVFQLHGTDHKGKCILRKKLSRTKLIEFMSNQPQCLIGIEACGGAHYWARTLMSMGHTVKMMAPQFVKPYVKSSKNDKNDSEGINEAVTRPNMRFVPLKNVEQQDTLLSHRCRELVKKQRTALANQIRGLLMEYGVTIQVGISQILNLPQILEDNQEKLTVKSTTLFTRLYEQFKVFNEQIALYEREIEQHAKSDPKCIAIQKIEGIGPITASAITATIGDPKVFKNGREVAAWLGLVPKQHSSGGKTKLGGITKRGDSYLRALLIHGGRSVVKICENKTDTRNLWITDKKQRCGFNKTAVAVANKNARIIWAMLVTGECYRPSSLSAG
jgi:transposase